MPEQYYGISCVYSTTLNFQIIKIELKIDLFIDKVTCFDYSIVKHACKFDMSVHEYVNRMDILDWGLWQQKMCHVSKYRTMNSSIIMAETKVSDYLVV